MKKYIFNILLLVVCGAMACMGTACVHPGGTTNPGDEIKDPEQPAYLSMTLEEKVGQLFIVRPEALVSPENVGSGVKDWTKEMSINLQTYPVGGIIIFGKNISSKAQLMNLILNYKAKSKYPVLVAVDEEGGPVARIANSGIIEVEKFASMDAIGRTGNTDEAEHAGNVIGKYLKGIGFNLNFAPVADVNSNPNNPVIGTRSFSSDPQVVASMVGAYLNGLHKHKILGTLKHFPGHGDTGTDSHSGYTSINKTWEQMLACEIIPFKANLQTTDLVMTAHITCPNVTSDGLPSTLSYEMISGKLRGELGYQGVVVTDGMEMGAITKHYSVEEATVKAIQAGVDIILVPMDLGRAYNAVLKAVEKGEISEERIDESLARIWKLKGAF